MQSYPSLLAVLFALQLPAGAGEFAIKDQPGSRLDLLRDGKVLARYMAAHDTSTPARRDETYKPFVHVFDPEGTAPITKGAGGDFTHHRGIFIGWNKMTVAGKSYDRWHMKGGDQVHEKFTTQKSGADGASFTSLVRWTGDTAGATLVEEERSIALLPAPAPAYAMIDMSSRLKAVDGETLLDGDPEHAGLHFRPANEVDRAATTYLYPKENAEPHKDRDYPWIGESYTVAGKRYSVVYLNHPSNPKDARISAYRDYGRFGLFFKTTIPAGETATFRARFLVFAGELPGAEFIQRHWNEYAGAKEPTPKTTAKPAEVGKSPGPAKKAATQQPK
jgi:hypothetical protein